MSMIFTPQSFFHKKKKLLRDLQELRNLKKMKKWEKKYGPFRLYHGFDKHGYDSVWVSFDTWAIKIGWLGL